MRGLLTYHRLLFPKQGIYGIYLNGKYIVATQSALPCCLTFTRSCTPTAVSTTQGDSQLVRRSSGEVPCSGTPREPHAPVMWFYDILSFFTQLFIYLLFSTILGYYPCQTPHRIVVSHKTQPSVQSVLSFPLSSRVKCICHRPSECGALMG